MFQPVLFVAFVVISTAQAVAGTTTRETLVLYALGVPFMVAGLWSGFKLFGKINDETSRIPGGLPPWTILRGRENRRKEAYRRLAAFGVPVTDLSRRRSLDASASSQSRNVAIFGSDAVALGQTIQ